MIKSLVIFALLVATSWAIPKSDNVTKLTLLPPGKDVNIFKDTILNKVRSILTIITFRRPTLTSLTENLRQLDLKRPLPEPKECSWYESKICPTNCKDVVSSVTATCSTCSARMQEVCMNVQESYATLVISQIQYLISEIAKLEQESLNRGKLNHKEIAEDLKKCEASKPIHSKVTEDLRTELNSMKVMLDKARNELRNKREERRQLEEVYGKEIASLNLKTENCSEKLKEESEKFTAADLKFDIARHKLRRCEEQKVNLTAELKVMYTTLEDPNRKFELCRNGTEFVSRIKIDRENLLMTIKNLEKNTRELTLAGNKCEGLLPWEYVPETIPDI